MHESLNLSICLSYTRAVIRIGQLSRKCARDMYVACRTSSCTKSGELYNRTIVRRFIEETINQGRMDVTVQFVWEDVLEQVPFPGQVQYWKV